MTQNSLWCNVFPLRGSGVPRRLVWETDKGMMSTASWRIGIAVPAPLVNASGSGFVRITPPSLQKRSVLLSFVLSPPSLGPQPSECKRLFIKHLLTRTCPGLTRHSCPKTPPMPFSFIQFCASFVHFRFLLSVFSFPFSVFAPSPFPARTPKPGAKK